MPHLFTVEFEAQVITAAGGDWDLFEFAPARDKPVELLSVELSQYTELGDAAEEIVRYRIIKGHTTSGATPLATPTARPLSPGSTISCTAECCNATIASGGTAINLWSGGWNVRNPGPIFSPLPQGSGFWFPAASTQEYGVVRLMGGAGSNALADDATISGTALLCEYP